MDASAGDLAERLVPFQGVVNFRDLGGYPTTSGRRTAWRRVYRSDALWRLTAEDMVRFESLGIRAVYDLRSDSERALHPNPVPSVALPLESQVPREELRDGSFLREAADAERRLRDVYLAIVATAAPLFGELFAGLARPDGLPAVIHCAGGKDRTGLAAALLLACLGVEQETILDDYELTDLTQTAERHREILGRFVALGMSEEAAAAFLASPRWVMADTLEAVDGQYGGVEGYLRGPAGLAPATLGALRRRLLE